MCVSERHTQRERERERERVLQKGVIQTNVGDLHGTNFFFFFFFFFFNEKLQTYNYCLYILCER